MASTARMVPKPTSHGSITGSRSCSHSNVAGGWSLLRTSGDQMLRSDEAAAQLRLLRSTLAHDVATPRRLDTTAVAMQDAGAIPERDFRASPKVNALSAFQVNYSWNYPKVKLLTGISSVICTLEAGFQLSPVF